MQGETELEHVLEALDDVDICHVEFLQVLGHKSACADGLLAGDFVLQRGIELALDHDHEVTMSIELDGLQSGKARLGKRTRAIGLSRDGKEHNGVLGKVLGLDLGVFGLPVVNLGVEELDAQCRVAFDERITPATTAAGAE